MDAVEYGIRCNKDDEKKLVKRINSFLASKNYRKMYKCKDKGGIRNIDDPENDQKIEYNYTQFLKQSPRWLFEIEPNLDLRNIYRFPGYEDCAWTIFFNRPFSEMNSKTESKLLDNFLEGLLSSTEFEYVLLHEYTEDDYRR